MSILAISILALGKGWVEQMLVCDEVLSRRTSSASLGQTDTVPFTYSKPQVIRLMSQIPQRQIPQRIGCHNKERLRLVYRYAQYDRELLEPDIDIGESANQAFSSENPGPQRKVAHMGQDHKTDVIFFRFICEVFPKQKWKCFRNENTFFETKMFLFRKHLRNASDFERKVKLTVFLKGKDLNLQTKVEVFPKRK